jgi:hypothetical protein
VAELFLARTKVQREAQGAAKNTFRYSFLFPTKATAEMIITLKPNQYYAPTPQESKATGAGAKVHGLKTRNDTKTNSYTISYFVPYSSLPPDVVQQLRGMATGPAALDRLTEAPHLRLAAYFPGAGIEAADEGGQESLPVPLTGKESSGQGEEGVTVDVALDWLKAALEDLEAFLKGAGLEIPGPEPSVPISSVINFTEALALSETDRDLLAQILAYQYCADNLSNLGVNPSALPQGVQAIADTTAGYASGDVGAQFVALLVKEAASLVGWVPLLGPTVEKQLNQLQQSWAENVQQDLNNLRALLPYCTGMWYGNFRITGSGPGMLPNAAGQSGPAGPTTFSDFGSLHFSVTNGQAKGKIDGNYKLNFAFPDMYNCTDESSYSGALVGDVQKGGLNIVEAKLTSYPYTSTGSLPSCTGPFCEIPGAQCSRMAIPIPSWEFKISLAGGQPSDYDLFSSPFSAIDVRMKQAGYEGHVTVTLRKLQ